MATRSRASSWRSDSRASSGSISAAIRSTTARTAIAAGADGQLSQARLEALLAAELEAGRDRGVLSLEPLLPTLREHGRALDETRTPNIICRAFDLPADPVVVPRGCKPIVPRRWLTSGFAFELSAR